MSVLMRGNYVGNKKVELIHDDSGTSIVTAAPKDNNGDGSSFSPTDLFCASLGACMLTIMSIVAEREVLDLTGAHFQVEKHMSTSPRRVGRIVLAMHLPSRFSPDTRIKLERAAATCPVHHSMHPEVELAIEYIYDV